MVDFSHRPILQQGPAMFSWRIPHALTWSFGFCGQRPGWIQLSLGLVFLGHSLWENLASLPPSGYWCGHRKYGFGNGAHVSFDGDENAFGAQPHDPRLFGSDLYLAFPWALCFGQPLPGQDISICILLKGFADGCWGQVGVPSSKPVFLCRGGFQFSRLTAQRDVPLCSSEGHRNMTGIQATPVPSHRGRRLPA